MKHIVPAIILILFSTAIASAATTEEIVSLYKKGEYKQVCKMGMNEYYGGNSEAHFAAMVGMACAKTDMINPLGKLQGRLVSSPALRSTATFFATLLLAKRMLYQHFVDGVPLQGFVLPKYKHILSVVFDHVSRGDFERTETGGIRFTEGNLSVAVSLSEGEKPRLYVDEYEGDVRVAHHWYR